MFTKKIIQGTILLTTLTFLSCNKAADNSTVSAAEDSSASGAAASSVGGSIASSSSSGTVATFDKKESVWNLVQPSAFAANICPTLKTANGAGCTTGTNAADISYGAACSFGTSTATWSGTLEVTLNPAAPVNCGTFPVPGSSSIQRQFVSAPGTPNSGSRTTAGGTVVVIDNSSTNLSNFDNQTIAPNIGSGFGSIVSFSSNVRTGVNVKQRVYVQGGLGFDHTIAGGISVAESAGVRTASGSVTVYHNKVKVVGTSVFTSVTYNDTSCVPTSGSIKTTFAAGANVAPTTIGQTLVGKFENLAFNGDGTATYTDIGGTSSLVKLSHCF